MRQIIHFDNMASMGTIESDLTGGVVNIPQFAWTKVVNMRFLGDRIEPFRNDNYAFGSATYSLSSGYNAAQTIFAARQKLDPAITAEHETVWVFGSTSGIWAGERLSATTGEDFAKVWSATSGIAHRNSIIFDKFGEIVIGSGGGIPVQWGDSSAGISLTKQFKFLENWSSTASVTCRFIKSFKNYLIAGNVKKGGIVYTNKVKWSHPSDFDTVPTSWDYGDATKDAGEYELGETNDKLIDSVPLDDINILYKENSVWGMEYIGAPNIFRFYKIFNNRGVHAINCAKYIFDGHHAVFDSNDIYIHDGQKATSIFPERFRQKIFSSIVNEQQQSLTPERQVFHHESRKEVWFLYRDTSEQTKNGMSRAAIWNYEHNTFYIKTFDSTQGLTGIHGEREYWLEGKTQGNYSFYDSKYLEYKIYGVGAVGKGYWRIDDSDPAASAAKKYAAGYIVKSLLPIGRQLQNGEIKADQQKYKTIYNIYPHYNTVPNLSATLEFSLLYTNKVIDPATTSTYKYITSQTEKIDTRESGRLFGIKIQWPESIYRITLSGFSLDTEIEGDR